MECKDCKMECIGTTPCEKCEEKMDIKAILKDVRSEERRVGKEC